MFENANNIGEIILNYISKSQYELSALLKNQMLIEKELGEVVEDKGDDHLAYAIDIYSNKILFEILQKYNVSCDVFSEEGGWKQIGGGKKYYIVCDPYCNTSLTMRSFRESAIAICVTNREGEFEACAIGDLQINRIFFADTTGSYLWNLNSHSKWIRTPMKVSTVSKLKESFLAASLLKRDRRIQTMQSSFFQEAKIIHNVDGAITIGRMASGYVDGYIDPYKGQPIYEIPCCQLILESGGIVTDINAVPFKLANVIDSLITEPKGRYQLIAAGTNSLHRELLESIYS